MADMDRLNESTDEAAGQEDAGPDDAPGAGSDTDSGDRGEAGEGNAPEEGQDGDSAAHAGVTGPDAGAVPDGESDAPEPDPAEDVTDEVPAADAEEAAYLAAAAAAAPEPEELPEEETSAPEKELAPEARALCRAAIEAMLFSSAEPVTARRLAEALKDFGVGGRGVRRIVTELAKEYDESRRGVLIQEVAGGFQVRTRPEYVEYVARLLGGGGTGRLSQAALETLAVVAYKQPVTRADIEAIRGVQAGPLLRTLLHRGLVKITGRAEILGRPLLYGTTKKFLESFGLKSLNELPKVEELPRP